MSMNRSDASNPTTRSGRHTSAISRLVYPGPQPRSTTARRPLSPDDSSSERVGDSNTSATRPRRRAARSVSPKVYSPGTHGSLRHQAAGGQPIAPGGATAADARPSLEHGDLQMGEFR